MYVIKSIEEFRQDLTNRINKAQEDVNRIVQKKTPTGKQRHIPDLAEARAKVDAYKDALDMLNAFERDTEQ